MSAGGGNSKSLRFTSSKCPAQEDATCELPFGLLWSPFVNDKDGEAVPPSSFGELCPVCLAYRNVYCKNASNDDDGTEDESWICPFCQFSVVSDPTETSLCIHDTVEYRQPVSRGALPEEQKILLVVDGNLPPHEAQAIGSLMESIVVSESTRGNTTVKIGLIVFDEVVSVYQLPTSSGMALCQDFEVVLGDGAVEEEDETAKAMGGTDVAPDVITDDTPYLMTVNCSDATSASTSSTTSALDPLWTCLAARFGFSLHSTKNSDTGASKPQQTSRLERLKQRKAERMKNSGRKSPTSTTIPTASATDAWCYLGKSPKGTPPRRCTGSALQCAADILVSGDRVWLFTNGCPNMGPGTCCQDTEDSDDLPVMDPHLVTTRAVPHFTALGTSVLEGMLVDVFCSGNNPLAVPVYQALVEASGGYVLLSHDENSPKENLAANAKYLYQQTQASLGQFNQQHHHGMKSELEKVEEIKEEHHPQASSAVNHPEWVEGCTADIRLSSCLSATHLIGPGELVEPQEDRPLPLPNEQAAFDSSLQRLLAKNPKLIKKKNQLFPAAETDCLRIRLGRYDPLTTFSVQMRLNDSYQPQYDTDVYVQVVIRYVQSNHLVTRVMTRRLGVARDVGEFLETIDEQVVPVVLGKEAVYRCMTLKNNNGGLVNDMDRLAYEAQQDLDQTIFQISAAFRLLSLEHGTKSIDLTEGGGAKAAGTSMDFAFPPELSDALRRLYHMRRGPFISPGPLQSLDDRAEMRSLFLRFPLEECLGMMAPSLWSSGRLDLAVRNGAPLYDSVPPDTLSLWENRIVAADHWHSVFIWSGSAATSPEYRVLVQHFRQFLLERSLQRFPAPTFHILTETDSMSRRFTALLAPSHGDPIEHQLAHFPALAQMTATERDKLQARYKFYDPDSDPSFRKWFWQVVSAANGSAGKQQGTSLCD